MCAEGDERRCGGRNDGGAERSGPLEWVKCGGD